MSGRQPVGAGSHIDLLSLVGLATVTTVAILVPGVPWQIQWILSIPFLVLLPGYAVVAALFPRHPTAKTATGGHLDGPHWAARAGLSVILSALLLAVLGVALSLLGTLRLAPVVLAVTGLIFVATLIAFIRRQRISQAGAAPQAVNLSPGRLPQHLGLSGLQTILLGVATLTLVASLVFAGAAPASQSTYSEVALLEDDGTVLGGDGSVTMVQNEPTSVYLRLENHEGGETTYRVIAQLQRVGENGGILEQRRIDDGQISVGADDTVVVERELTPSLTGDRLRLRYLIYTGSVPENPGPQNADLSLRVWVTVLGGNSS